jgi:hypothetical protein
MSLAENDEMIKALTPNGAAEPMARRIDAVKALIRFDRSRP